MYTWSSFAWNARVHKAVRPKLDLIDDRALVAVGVHWRPKCPSPLNRFKAKVSEERPTGMELCRGCFEDR